MGPRMRPHPSLLRQTIVRACRIPHRNRLSQMKGHRRSLVTFLQHHSLCRRRRSRLVGRPFLTMLTSTKLLALAKERQTEQHKSVPILINRSLNQKWLSYVSRINKSADVNTPRRATNVEQGKPSVMKAGRTAVTVERITSVACTRRFPIISLFPSREQEMGRSIDRDKTDKKRAPRLSSIRWRVSKIPTLIISTKLWDLPGEQTLNWPD